MRALAILNGAIELGVDSPALRTLLAPATRAAGAIVASFSEPGLASFALSDDGKKLFEGQTDGRTIVVNLATGARQELPWRHAGPVNHIKVAGDVILTANTSVDIIRMAGDSCADADRASRQDRRGDRAPGPRGQGLHDVRDVQSRRKVGHHGGSGSRLHLEREHRRARSQRHRSGCAERRKPRCAGARAGAPHGHGGGARRGARGHRRPERSGALGCGSGQGHPQARVRRPRLRAERRLGRLLQVVHPDGVRPRRQADLRGLRTPGGTRRQVAELGRCDRRSAQERSLGRLRARRARQPRWCDGRDAGRQRHRGPARRGHARTARRRCRPERRPCSGARRPSS